MNNFQEVLKRNPLKTKQELESAFISLTQPVYHLILFVKLSETIALHLRNSKRLPVVFGSVMIF